MENSITTIDKSSNDLLQKVATAVKNWVAIDDELKEISKVAKDLRNKKKELEENILNFMTKYDHETIDITNGKLKRNISQSVKPINEDLILNTLTDCIKDPTQAQIITNLIKSKREVVEKVNLKRLGNKR
jgi:hypothetical protein